MIRSVFQNKHFIVCNKQAQVLSVPAREKSDPRPCLGTELQRELKTQVFPVHRLDFEVSGLIIYALEPAAHKASQKWFEKKLIQKKYVAQTGLQNFSHWPENVTTDRRSIEAKAGAEFIWNTQILRGKRRSFESVNGEWAETRALINSVNKDAIIWHLYPVTGKPHQLRLELSRRGFPIHGDILYGSEYTRSEPGIALEAVEIDLSKVADRFGLPEIISLPKLTAKN